MGAIALFGETYDETVRIVEIGGPWSVELCGGTHVQHSSQIGPIALTSESSIGSGVRRVEAAVGIEAFHRLAAERSLLAAVAGSLKVQPAELPGADRDVAGTTRAAEKELEKLPCGRGSGLGRDLGRRCGSGRRRVAGGCVGTRGHLRGRPPHPGHRRPRPAGRPAGRCRIVRAAGDAVSFVVALTPEAVGDRTEGR